VVTYFFDCEECVHREFVPSGHTDDQYYYREMLHRMKQQVRQKHPKRWWKQNRLIHKDNFSPLKHGSELKRLITSLIKHNNDSISG
jgi:hypothetical protein